MSARFAAVKGGDDVWHRLLRGNDAKIEPFPLQEIADVSGRDRRVSRRIGAGAAQEAAEESDQALAIGIEPVGQLLAVAGHVTPRFRQPRPCRRRSYRLS